MNAGHLLIPLVTAAVAGLGSHLTSGGMKWYRTLKLRSWTPSGAVIGSVWTVLFVMATASALMVWSGDDRLRTAIMWTFAANAALNVLWSLLFFRLRLMGWAAFEAVILGLSVVLLCALIWPGDSVAAVLLLPYAGWTFFAAYLTWSIRALNRRRPARRGGAFRPVFVTAALATLIGGGLLAFFSTNYVRGGSVSGTFLRSQNWSGVISVAGDVTIAPWTALTIEPGTRVLFERRGFDGRGPWSAGIGDEVKRHDDPTGRQGYEQAHIRLSGRVRAVGAPGRPIVFAPAVPSGGQADWQGLFLATDSRLEFVDVSGARNAVVIEGYGVTVKYSKLHDSLWDCVDVRSTSAEVANNDISHCWRQAIEIEVPGPNLVRDNLVHDSTRGLACGDKVRAIVSANRFLAAPVGEDCGDLSGNEVESGWPDAAGGYFGGRLIYPAD